MSKYFTTFPKLQYDGVLVRDITRRTNFVKTNLSSPYVFLPYTVKEDEKPEDVAYYYYGSVDATWLVLMANNIIDPYNGWPLSEETFHKYLISKYEEYAGGASGYAIVDWCQNETISDNILFLYKTDETTGRTLKISTGSIILSREFTSDSETITSDSTLILNSLLIPEQGYPNGYIPMRIYEYEKILNENKREIQLVDKTYYDQISKEFRRLINA